MNPHPYRITFVAVIFAVIGIFSAGFVIGLRSRPVPSASTDYRVRGDSMAPTIKDGDVCEIVPPGRPLQVGDVIAVSWDRTRRVKRVAAVAGDRVRSDSGRLLVNDIRLEDRIADRREPPRIPPALVRVAASVDSWKPIDGATTPGRRWLGFTYRNPYQAGRATPVPDDYPDNQSVSRPFNRADRLVLRVPTGARVLFYDEFGSARLVVADANLARFRDAIPVASNPSTDLEQVIDWLDAEHPIAINGVDPIDLNRVEVWREIEYRVDRRGQVDRRTPESLSPLTLSADEVFVVGDNVPVSIDSRTVGPIPTSAVIGRVERVVSSAKSD